MNLPRCSPRIGYQLSDDHTLREVVIAAFGPTWENWFGCLRSRLVTYATFAEDYAERFGGDPNFQVRLHSHSQETERAEGSHHLGDWFSDAVFCRVPC